MNNQNHQRSTEEYIILALSGLTAICLFPFAVLRLMNAEWAIAALDIAAVLGASALFYYVFRYRETKQSGRIMTAICLSVLLMTISIKGAENLNWAYPALTAVFFLITPKTAAFICSLCLVALGAIIWDDIALIDAMKFYISAAATLLFSFAFADRMRKQQEQLLHLATKDPLTGTGNRRAMEQKLLDLNMHQRRGNDHCSSLILMDLDRFKLINDQHGHAVGDDILVQFAEVVSGRIRTSDSLYRFGGEEFVVIAENTELDDAVNLAEQLRSAVETCPIMCQYKVTISVGTAEFERNETPYEWLGRADKAMYQAKDMGRNICCVA